MCDEFYCLEKVQQSKFQQDTKKSNRKNDSDTIVNKTGPDEKLHEMEEQLEIAENRCNSLKDQLDQMKKLYQNKTEVARSRKSGRTISSARKLSELQKNSDAGGYQEKLSTPALMHVQGDNIISNIVTEASKMCNSTVSTYSNINKFIKEDDKSSSMLIRQNSQAISTDTSGAAVQTINNILNGITASVNRLSQLHVKLDCDKPHSARKNKVKETACRDDEQAESGPLRQVGSAPDSNEDQFNEDSTVERSHKVRDGVPKTSVLSIQSKSNNTRKKHKYRSQPKQVQHSTITVNITNKKNFKSTAKHVEKKFKIEPVKMLNQDSSSILSPRAKKQKNKKYKTPSRERFTSKQRINPKFPNTDTDKLVEIYHNNAAKDSDSDESNNQEEEKAKTDGKPKTSSETVPSLPLDEYTSEVDRGHQPSRQQSQIQNHRFFHITPPSDQGACNYQRQLTPIDENTYAEPTAPRMECYNNYAAISRNYELPTIASKMKQVAKSYMRQFNLNAIPFCAAKSTSPSHNIGINIQQVMSIIKTRQPITGISPTLAHNIGLAAEKLHNRSLSAMVSTLGSAAGSFRCDRMSCCPLNRNSLNYQQLQEMAKEIPEEPEDEDEAVETGAAGDTNRTYTWTVDPLKMNNCSCIPQKGVGFQQVLNKYQNVTAYSSSTVSQPMSRTKYGRLQTTTAQMKARMWNLRQETLRPSLDGKTNNTLKGKEQNLKEVLTNLHNEFAYLNAEYENLSNKVAEGGNDPDEQVTKQLENMERCLNNKEEEISMVMALYKEVVALKQQVKVLKEKASIASVALSQQHQQERRMQCSAQHRFRDYNDPHAAIHLTKLLRQIQTYQEMNRIGRRS